MSELAIFDLDGVIINGQSQQIFLNYIFKKKLFGLFFYFKLYLWFIFYRLGLVKNPKKMMDFAFSFLKDRKEEEFIKIAENFFNEVLHKFIFSEIIDIINKHKANNRELLIISNSEEIFIKPIAEFLGIKNYIGTKLEVVNGKFTGKISGNIVYGKNKVNYLKEFIQKNNLNLSNSYAYADHISDLDLLMASSAPCAVNSDRELLREAKKRNWKILKFKKNFNK